MTSVVRCQTSDNILSQLLPVSSVSQIQYLVHPCRSHEFAPPPFVSIHSVTEEMNMSKRLMALLSTLLILSLLAGCAAPVASPAGEQAAAPEAAAPEAAAGEAPEQVIIRGFDVGPGGDPQVIPYFNGAGTTWMSKLYTPLVMMSSDFSELTPEGSLSESWESNEDMTTWTFNLRPGVKWHDGEPFTAEDVKFTFKLVNDPESVTINTGIYGG